MTYVIPLNAHLIAVETSKVHQIVVHKSNPKKPTSIEE